MVKKPLAILALILVLTIANVAQDGAAIFKIPEGVFPMDWNKSGFMGMLFLEKDLPAGIFVAYPNNGGEEFEALRERAAEFIAPMVSKFEKGKSTFTKRSIPINKDDVAESALYYSFEDEKDIVQILFYRRPGPVKHLLYGYFAKRSKDEKPERYKNFWADENGQGVDKFKKFVKSIK